MMNRKLICTACTIAVLSIISSIDAWAPIDTLHRIRSTSNNSPTMLLSKAGSKHPGFQDCYDSDDDCLSTTYSAAFVAEEWIKSMPCGKDADCLPEELSHPGTMKDSGVDKVDVMEYLNIKKAEPVSSDKKVDSGP